MERTEVAELESGNFKMDDSFPLNLVRDFGQFIDYIQRHSVQLTKKWNTFRENIYLLSIIGCL